MYSLPNEAIPHATPCPRSMFTARGASPLLYSRVPSDTQEPTCPPQSCTHRYAGDAGMSFIRGVEAAPSWTSTSGVECSLAAPSLECVEQGRPMHCILRPTAASGGLAALAAAFTAGRPATPHSTDRGEGWPCPRAPPAGPSGRRSVLHRTVGLFQYAGDCDVDSSAVESSFGSVQERAVERAGGR